MKVVTCVGLVGEPPGRVGCLLNLLRLKCPSIGVVWKLGEGMPAHRCHPCHMTMVQNYKVHHPKSPQVAE
ncbi:hypothetical protein TNCV_3496801 [Trichonephila clavipes]|nr:hypothetical protein TNCV_3496801 [Trichonephila clavipes]